MKTSTRILAVSALAALFSVAAHAQGEADNAPEFARPFQSTASVDDVKAGAYMPLKVSNGSTGFIGVTNSGLTREAVKAEAVMAVRRGATSHGELGSM